ncbi:MAG: DUF3343 domain-containing protein [Firmicutes bacterium]|nr:DUF3343 domain-containing protein [Bacillota bacterium]
MAVNCYFTFPTVYFALRAEAVLKDSGCSFKMVPVPRAISSSCGTALRCPCEEIDAIKEVLENNKVQWDNVHLLQEEEPRPRSRGLLARKEARA